MRLFAALEALGAAEYVEFDPNIMRGLLYYTGTVFEAFDVSGSVRRAILGGGRYDNLLRDVGGEPLSGVGFAMGDVVIGLVLQELGLIPPLATTPAAVLVTVFSPELQPESLKLAARAAPGRLQRDLLPGSGQAAQTVQVCRPDGHAGGAGARPGRGRPGQGHAQGPVQRHPGDAGAGRAGRGGHGESLKGINAGGIIAPAHGACSSMAESLTVDQAVVGSTPIAPPKKKTPMFGSFFIH